LFIQFSTLINPSYISSQSVGCCFKGLQTFDTAVLEFKFQNSFVTFDFKIHPAFCLKKGCILCLKKDAILYITKICILYFFSFCSTEGAFLWKKSRLYSLVSLTIGWLTFHAACPGTWRGSPTRGSPRSCSAARSCPAARGPRTWTRDCSSSQRKISWNSEREFCKFGFYWEEVQHAVYKQFKLATWVQYFDFYGIQVNS
jgi:hypothetical protein